MTAIRPPHPGMALHARNVLHTGVSWQGLKRSARERTRSAKERYGNAGQVTFPPKTHNTGQLARNKAKMHALIKIGGRLVRPRSLASHPPIDPPHRSLYRAGSTDG